MTNSDSKTIKRKAVPKPAKPFLKWVGGKGKLLSELKAHIPKKYKSYYEPFVGGGALFFSLNPEKAHINDMNDVLVDAYLHIRDSLSELIKELSNLQTEYWNLTNLDTKKDFFLIKRNEFNELKSGLLEKTVLLIFLNKTCFNGMYRENSKGKFNVPFGKQEKPNICDRENLTKISQKLKTTTISSGSYKLAIKNAKEGDFIYFDPPYHPLNETSSFTSYHADGFTADDQQELRDACLTLIAKKCRVMVSNSSAPLIRELYEGSKFEIFEIQAARNINSKGTGRGKITELVIVSKNDV